jgi:hypothetical protein
MAKKYEPQGLAPLQVELREAMGKWGCPLCRLSHKAEHAYIDSLNYERVLDLNTRDAIKASRGLCEHHSRMWQQLQGSALGIAIVYRVTILDLLRDTNPETNPGNSSLFRRRNTAQQTAERLGASGSCVACEIAQGVTDRFGSLLLKDLDDPAVQSLLVTSGGLCLPHLRDVLVLPGGGRRHDSLIQVHREAWQQLMGELDEFIRKNDYRFRDEAMTDAEGTSWSRSIDVIVGLQDQLKEP